MVVVVGPMRYNIIINTKTLAGRKNVFYNETHHAHVQFTIQCEMYNIIILLVTITAVIIFVTAIIWSPIVK